MRSTSLRAASAALAMAAAASAAFVRVDVGKDGLVYTPDTITPAMGDTVEFHFFGPNHTVTQGTFDSPCKAMDGGFYSGFQPPSGSNTEADNVFQVVINSTDPMFVYCSQPTFTHCISGMVLAINPSSDQTLAAYKKGASSASAADVPDAVSGGTLVAAAQAQVTSDSSSGSSSSSGGSSSGGFGGLYGGGASVGGSSEAGHIGASLSGVAAAALGMAVLLL